MAALKTVLAALMLAALGACMNTAAIIQPAKLESGDGVIENISVEQTKGSSVSAEGVGSGVSTAGVAGNTNADGQNKRVYQLGVRMESGLYQSVTQDSNPFKVGDPVRIVGGKIRRR